MSIDFRKATRKTLLKDRQRYVNFLSICIPEQKPVIKRLIADIDFELEERNKRRLYYIKRNNIR